MVPTFALLNPIRTTFFTTDDDVVGSDNDDSVYVFYWIFESFVQCVLIIFTSPLLQDSLTLPSLPNFVVLFVSKPIKSDFAVQVLLVVWFSTGVWSAYQGPRL